MRPKVRIVLPFVQVLVAVALITSNVLRPNPIRNPPFMAPDWQLCAGLNAPATLTRGWLAKNHRRMALGASLDLVRLLDNLVHSAGLVALVSREYRDRREGPEYSHSEDPDASHGRFVLNNYRRSSGARRIVDSS